MINGFPARHGGPKKWLVYFMENLNLKWMMWGYSSSGTHQKYHKCITTSFKSPDLFEPRRISKEPCNKFEKYVKRAQQMCNVDNTVCRKISHH